jgi:hypothetical protein
VAQAGFQVVGGVIRAHKIEPTTRADVHSIEGLVIQHEWERQRDRCLAPDAVIARVGSSRHDRISSGCYRVLAIRAIVAVAGDRAIGRVGQRWRLYLARATTSSSGRGEERQKGSGEEDKQAKQNARIQEGRLTSASLFHNAGLLRAAPILGSVAKESRDVFLFVFGKSHGCLGGPFPRGTSLSVAALQQAISALAPGVHPLGLALRRSFSAVPARGDDSFHRATCAWHQIPCGNRCFVRSARGRASRLDS